jgi:hypothetical protein
MSSIRDWVQRVVLGRPDELTEALQFLDAKETAAIADIQALRRRADEQIERLSQRSLV